MTEFNVVVSARETAAQGVIALQLESADGTDLPAWEPGAHIDLILPNNMVRQYSLCGHPADRSVYRLGILHEPHGRGGSAAICDRVAVGDHLTARGPRNHFNLVPARAYIFIAGGIGITPILPMIAHTRACGAATIVLYGGRNSASMAFCDEVLALDPDAHICPQDQMGLLDLDPVLGVARPDTEIYCCGPEPLLAAVTKASAHWQPGSLHIERFSAAPTGAVGGTFCIQLQRRGLQLEVPAHRSILDVLTEAGVDVLTSCEDGVCGTCLTPLLDGTADHRDSVLSDAERSANEVIAVCVSRAAPGSTLVLDL